MLRLLVVFLSLLASGSAQRVQLGEHPLLTTAIAYMNQTLACVGPCALDSIDYIVGEIVKGDTSANAICVQRFIADVASSFPPPPAPTPVGFNLEQYYTMQWLYALGRPGYICPRLDIVARCFVISSNNVCGDSSRAESEMVMRSLLSFLDCNVSVSNQLRIFDCLVPVAGLFSQAPIPGYIAFQQCIAQGISYFQQGYEMVYRDISGTALTFSRFESNARSLVQCFLQWSPSFSTANGSCDNAVAHVNRQVNSFMVWLRDRDGRSMFTCLGDLALYNQPIFQPCINTFVTNAGGLIRRVSDELSNGNVANLRNFLKELATDTCRTSDVPNLIRCIETVLQTRPGKRCSEAVIPTARNIYMPTLQYMYLLGGCRSRVAGGTLLSAVCQCDRAIPGYTFRREVSSQCEMDRLRSYTISFGINNPYYTPYELTQLKANLQPGIDAIYREIYATMFIGSENYRFQRFEEYLKVTIDLVFDESVNTNPNILLSFLPEIIVGMRGQLYEVIMLPGSPPPPMLSLQTIIIIVVVGVVGVMLIVVLMVCCCCSNGCRRREQVYQEKTIIHVPPTNYAHPSVNPGLCVQQRPVLAPYGQCSCQPLPTKTILQFQ